MTSEWARFWPLDRGIAFLNHGSFGACPSPVLEAQARWRDRLERQPVQFLARDLEGLLDSARGDVAAFLGCDAPDLAFVPNATAGVNAVLRSLDLREGDELLRTDHEYNACRNAMDHVARRSGARVVVAAVPFPLSHADEVIEAVLARVTPRTRLAMIDHVTSPTGLVFPIERIVAALSERGVDTLVDGAHAPGMVPFTIAGVGAAYYTGNCHKWLCAPKGAGFLHVRRDRQRDLHPIAISHGLNSPRTDRSRFLLEFDWTGTDDPSAVLCVPESIRFMGSLLPEGWPELMARNRALALDARKILCDALGIPPPCPDDMIGSLASLPIPDGPDESPRSPFSWNHVQERILAQYAIEVPVLPWPAPPRRLVRISAQIYNDREQYVRLGQALGSGLTY